MMPSRAKWLIVPPKNIRNHEMTERQTISSEAFVAADVNIKAAMEAENALLQFDLVLDLIDENIRDGRAFRLKQSTILALHAKAMHGIHPQAGTWRNAPVEIAGSAHQPPAESLVVAKIEDLCDWVNENWARCSAIELCSYLMWRLNWIHPFADGNGRTTRAVAYLVLCVRSGARLPGYPTIPEQIAADKAPYYAALEAADTVPDGGEKATAAMQMLLEQYLQCQLDAVFAAAKEVGAVNEAQRKFH
jgi:Fic family protein